MSEITRYKNFLLFVGLKTLCTLNLDWLVETSSILTFPGMNLIYRRGIFVLNNWVCINSFFIDLPLLILV